MKGTLLTGFLKNFCFGQMGLICVMCVFICMYIFTYICVCVYAYIHYIYIYIYIYIIYYILYCYFYMFYLCFFSSYLTILKGNSMEKWTRGPKKIFEIDLIFHSFCPSAIGFIKHFSYIPAN